MKVLLLESPQRSGYKFTDTHKSRQTTEYQFNHAGGAGQIIIRHSDKFHPDDIHFATRNHAGYKPNHANAVAILKTVVKAARLHLKQNKPKSVAYNWTSDHRDRDGHSRRAAIYHRLAGKLLSRSYKEKPFAVGSHPSNAKRFTRTQD